MSRLSAFFRRNKPPVKPDPPSMRDDPQEVEDRRLQRFPTGYVDKTINRFQIARVGNLMGRQKKSDVDWYISKIFAGADRYKKASKLLKVQTGYDIPWQIIGVIHGMEASFNFKKQLLNGQPINKRTTWVPKGRGPWSSWEVSCIDAFTWDDDYKIVPEVWGIAETALFLERWNGMTYWKWGKPSPYLWAYSTVQVRGKFVADGKYSNTAISLQVGAMVQLKEIGFFSE